MSEIEPVAIIEGFKRDYRSDPIEDSHRPYVNMLHTDDDVQIDIEDKINEAMKLIPEGNKVRLIVVDVGERHELADDFWCLLEPHIYGPHSKREDAG